MSSRAKGNRTKREGIALLEKWGYITETIELTGRWTKYKDAWAGYCTNCWKREDECCDEPERFDGFDIMAMKGKHIIFVQLKTNSPAVQGPYKKWAKKYVSRNIKCWVMTKYDYEGWRIQKYYSNGTIKEIDLR